MFQSKTNIISLSLMNYLVYHQNNFFSGKFSFFFFNFGVDSLSSGQGDRYERCVSEAELLLDQSVCLEQAGEVAAALTAVNEAVCKHPLPVSTSLCST